MLRIAEGVENKLSKEDVGELRKAAGSLDEILRRYGRPFQPLADYDQKLDCIRVIVRDCSPCEYRINEWLTVAHDSDPASAPGPVGFTLKGVRELLEHNENIIKITDALDALIKKAPDETVLYFVSELKRMSRDANLRQVQFEST